MIKKMEPKEHDRIQYIKSVIWRVAKLGRTVPKG